MTKKFCDIRDGRNLEYNIVDRSPVLVTWGTLYTKIYDFVGRPKLILYLYSDLQG